MGQILLCKPQRLLNYDIHSLRQARFHQVTSSILWVLSVIEIPGSMMYQIIRYLKGHQVTIYF